MAAGLDSLKAALAHRYEIERELGHGGMATVYLARDLKHGRRIAIKVMKSDLGAATEPERFRREIETTAQLRHPNILPLYDSGEADGTVYFISPWVEDGSLKDRLGESGPLPISEAVRIVTEVAEALGEAHRGGIIHRDIKPANILLDQGRAVVADFGIACALGEPSRSRLTEAGSNLGTPGYMSPEQAFDGGSVDHRADIYAMGSLLYEMLTGEPPFVGPTVQSVLAKQATQTAPSARVLRSRIPAAIDRTIQKALSRAPSDRFDSTGTFVAALHEGRPSTIPEPLTGASTQSGVRGVEGTRSLVVIPFENRSPDPENAYFSDGLTDEIISDLSKLGAVHVISRATSSQLKGTVKDLATIGLELGVEFVLTGSVRRAEGALRITAELADAATSRTVWSEKYGGTTSDIFELQERLSRQIVDALQVAITPAESERLAARPIADVKVFERYLMAREEMYRFTPTGFARAEDMLTLGLEEAGENALLLATRGLLIMAREGNQLDPAPSWPAESRRLAERALELDPDCPVAHEVLGMSEAFHRRDVAEGIRMFRRAHELEPSNSSPLLWLVELYSYVGWGELAIETGRKAMALDPWSWLPQAKLACGYLWAGEMEAFREETDRLIARYSDQSMPDWFNATFRLPREGRVQEMRELIDRWESVLPHDVFWRCVRFLERGLSGDREGAMEVVVPGFEAWGVGNQEYAWLMADGYAIMGEVDRALDSLEEAVDQGFINYPFLAEHDVLLEPLRGEPRFKAILEGVKREWETFEV